MESFTLKNGAPLMTVAGKVSEALLAINEEYSPEWKG